MKADSIGLHTKSYLKLHFFPKAFPIRETNGFDALVLKEVLTVNARFCHCDCSVFQESHDANFCRNFTKLQDKINFCMNFMINFATILIALSKLCRISAGRIHTNRTSFSYKGHQVSNTSVLDCLFTSLIVH